MSHPYEDIIDRPHHRSSTRPHMSAHDRAAQFSPFAALTGFESAIHETGRTTDQKVELDESVKADLNDRLILLQEQLNQAPLVTLTYFLPDPRKPGGSYETLTGCIRKIDASGQRLIMEDGTVIPLDDLAALRGELFRNFGP